MRKYNPTNSKISVDEKGKVSFEYSEEIKPIKEAKGTDIFKKYNKVISRMSDKDQGEMLDALYSMNTEKGARYKDAWSKVKELLNMDYHPEGSDLQEAKPSIKEKGPCWPGYKQVGTKMKNGKEVPNCVPIDEYVKEDLSFGFDTMKGANEFKRKFPDTKPVQIVKVDGKKRHIVTLTEPDMNFIQRVEKAAKLAAKIGVDEQK